jgi:hypothetical protein
MGMIHPENMHMASDPLLYLSLVGRDLILVGLFNRPPIVEISPLLRQ